MNENKMRAFLLIMTSLCLLAAVVACILGIWGYVGKDAAWKTVATVSVIMMGTYGFKTTVTYLWRSDDDDDF